jgi:carbon-monoxide dehydrogenase iron sulfur subunit
VAHSQSKDIIKTFLKESPQAQPRVSVQEDGAISFALQCRHCPDAPCVTACISGAMYRDEESGVVKHNTEKCVGCWSCLLVCPYGAVQPDENGKKIALKCDFCLEEGNPVCVENCPNRALVLVEVENA